MGKVRPVLGLIRDKILQSLPFLFCHPKSEQLIHDSMWIGKLSHLYYNLIKIYPNYPPKLFFRSYLVSIGKAINNEIVSQDQIIQLWIECFNSSDDKNKFFITKLFYVSGFLNDAVVSMIIKYALETPSLAKRYYTIMDISMETFRWAKGYYSEYYSDRKQVLQKISEELNLQYKYVNKNENKKKLCIVVYMLEPSFYNSVQRVACMFANNLSSFYDNILVVSLETFSTSRREEKDVFYCYKRKYSGNYLRKIQAFFSSNVEVYIPDNDTFVKKNSQVLNKIYTFDPDLILDISDEMSAISYIYNKNYLACYVPMRNSATSLSYSGILGMPFKYMQTNQKYNNCIDLSKVLEWSFPEYIPQQQGSMTKKELGLNEDQFCIVSIGNNSCFSNSFSHEICDVLKQNEKLVWLLIGSKAPDYIHKQYGDLIDDKRIIEWGYENKLAGICRACDVHLRYDMTGGSGATAIAAMQGLPIVMTNYICDASRWLGLEYSSIDNYHDLALEIQRLFIDKAYYEERSQVALNLVGKAVDSEEKWRDLHNILSSACERWKRENNG